MKFEDRLFIFFEYTREHSILILLKFVNLKLKTILLDV